MMQWDDPFQRPQDIIPVIQGEYRVIRDGHVVLSTVLGSCVSVALFDRSVGIGGLNHFLLPDAGQSGSGGMKFGAMANELLINELLKAGAARTRLQAKLFGGASMVATLGDIGARNVQFARDYMRREGIAIADEAVGGCSARRLQFHPVSGRTKVFTVSAVEGVRVAQRERPTERDGSKSDITLF